MYNVSVIDRNGLQSSPYTCDTSVAFVIQPPSLAKLFAFMAIAVSSLTTLSLSVFALIWSIQRKLDMKHNKSLKFFPKKVYQLIDRLKETRSQKPLLELSDLAITDEEVSLLEDSVPNTKKDASVD